MEGDANVTQLGGVGTKTAKSLEKLNIFTVEDLLFHLPAYYKDLRKTVPLAHIENKEDTAAVIRASVTTPPRWIKRMGKFSVFTFEVADGTGVLDINLFNLPFLFGKYKPGQSFLFFGKIKLFRERPQMDNPEIFPVEKPPGILAYYPLTAGITQRKMRLMMKNALAALEEQPAYSSAFCRTVPIQTDKTDFRMLHLPADEEEPLTARKSLVWKELLLFNRMIDLSGHDKKEREPLPIPENAVEAYIGKLPFTCTGAQLRSIQEIARDLSRPFPANRLVQGDVGSGKTAVALFAAFAVSLLGAQSIIMAPTELLAEQHFAFAQEIFGPGAALLTGSTGKKERGYIAAGLADGSIQVLISTHAVLYAPYPFKNLQVLIIDEQHRFGVLQRSLLVRKNPTVHSIILSATPIPRSLAIVLYGKADISILDEMPPGRLPVKTFLVGPNKRPDMYDWIFAQVRKGEKAYIICPLLEPSEGLPYLSVTELYAELSARFKDTPMEVLHGKLPSKTKQGIIQRFRSGETPVLISTTVVEVGVDVSDATIVAVENADAFGLSQLHQIRGRVGRGKKESYCYFLTNGSSLERLKILKDCSDGFEIAKKDLQFRGAGEFFGTRQHGETTFRVADIVQDADIFLQVRTNIDQMQQKFPRDYRLLTALARENAKKGRYLSV